MDRWREESGQLTRAVAPAHGAGEQKGACEQTGSGSGRGDGPRRPRAAPRGTHRGEGGRATWRPGAPAPRGSREQRRGEASSSAQHNAACPPHRGLPCRGRPLRPAPAPRRSCTAGGRRRARFKPLPGRMSTGAGAGLGGPTAGRGPAGAAVPPSRPPARSCHLGAARGLRDPPQAMGLSNSPPPPPLPGSSPGPRGLSRSGLAAEAEGPSPARRRRPSRLPFQTCPHAPLAPVRPQLSNTQFRNPLLLERLTSGTCIPDIFRNASELSVASPQRPALPPN